VSNDLGIEHGAAVADASHGVGEPLDLGDAVLEPVADALRATRQQLTEVAVVDVLRLSSREGT